MFLGKVISAHGPVLVAFKRGNRVFIATLHFIANISREQWKHLKKLPTDLIRRLNVPLVLLICLSNFFESVIGAKLALLSKINCLFLTNRSIEIDMLLLECTH